MVLPAGPRPGAWFEPNGTWITVGISQGFWWLELCFPEMDGVLLLLKWEGWRSRERTQLSEPCVSLQSLLP